METKITISLLALVSLILTLSAALPEKWDVDLAAQPPQVFALQRPRGETYALEAVLKNRGKPFAPAVTNVCIFWQTNGMESTYWSAPAYVSNNVLRATWLPSMDPGATTVRGYIGDPGHIYAAAFQFRFTSSPGPHPNALPLPTQVIDFSRITVLNPPWSGGGGSGVFDTNSVIDIVRKTVDGAAKMLPKYLWCKDFDDSYPDDAAAYYRSRGNGKVDGGCSSVRDGGFLYRNFDFPLDERAEFVVKMAAGPGRFASVGVAQVGTNLTEQMVTSGKPSRWYKSLPGATTDGINENGVVCEINVVDGEPQWRSGILSASDIHPLAAVRWALDNGTSAGMAASNLAARIRFPSGWTQNFHWMIADETQTWIVENGACSNVTGRAVMTNFPLLPTPTYGAGWERYIALTNGESITNVWYTRAYSPYTDWFSDFGNSAALMSGAKAFWNDGREKEQHRGETVYGQSWWQTVHTSIYDIQNRILRICVQETDDWYTFSVPSSVTPEDLASKRDKTDTCVYVPKLIAVTIDGRAADRLEWNSETAEWEHYMTSVIKPIGNGMLQYISTQLPQGEIIFKEYDDEVDFDYGSGLIHLKFESSGLAKVNDRLALASQLPSSDELLTAEQREAVADIPKKLERADVVDIVHGSTTNLFRTFGDEYVYEPDGFSDFEWRGDRVDAIAVIGSLQPTETQTLGGYSNWMMAFEMDGHYYWGDARALTASPEVVFTFYSDFYDEYTGEWVYDSFGLTAVRHVTGYHRTNPIDIFARRSRLEEVAASAEGLRNRIDGETKVLRTGGDGERGTGWGYLQTSLDGDYRNWRFRVPKWTNITGATTNDTGVSQTYVSWTNGNSRSVGYSVILNNPLSWSPAWAFDRTVRETRGAQGLDAVQQADYDVGILRKSSTVSGGSTYYLGYTVEQNASMSVKLSMDMAGWVQTNRVYKLGSGGSEAWITVPGWYRPIREHVSRSWIFALGDGYEDIATYDSVATGMFVRSEDLIDFYTSLPEFRFYTVCENEHVKIVRSRDGSDAETILDETIHDSLHYCVIRVSSISSTTFEDAFAPYYKLVGTLDYGIFYDEEKDCSWQIKVRNGCFFQEKYCDGDWRR